MSILSYAVDCKNRLAGWFVDREFFMRSNGQVRFIKIPAKLQRRVAGGIAGVTGLWLAITLGMAFNQVSISFERMALVKKEARIQSAAERVAAYRGSLDDVTADLKRRQDMLESVAQPLLGKDIFTGANAAKSDNDEQGDETAKKIGAAIPEAAALAQIESRQIRFAERMTKMAQQRADRAANAIRQYGLNPDSLMKAQTAGRLNAGQGGPFIPFFGGSKNKVADPRFDRMADALERMTAMENALNAVPTSMPATAGLVSSSYGYRRDPFTGGGAMHSGTDFKGPIGTPIRAAADGKITFVGGQSGYGKTIEITHANGLVTRYAHLSGYTVSVGQSARRGIQIGKMGSTGRSTGSHLHFEVRLNGQAVNPLKFLEANPDVLEVQTRAGNQHRASTKSS